MAAAASGPALYAFTLGLVAALNPCGFPLLPAYLTVFVSEPGAKGWSRQTASGLLTGASVTAGFVLVFGALGALVDSGVGVLSRWVPWVMIPLGLGLVGVGALAAAGRTLHVPLPAISTGRHRGVLAMVFFGIAYAVASLSCALPLFLAGVAGSFTRQGIFGGTLSALAYALGMGLFLTVAALVVAWAGGPALRRFRGLGRIVPRLAGVVLAAVGAYLVLYWTADLADPLATPGPVRVVEGIQASLSNALASSPRLVGLVLGGIVIAAVGVAALVARPTARSNVEGSTTLQDATGGQELREMRRGREELDEVPHGR